MSNLLVVVLLLNLLLIVVIVIVGGEVPLLYSLVCVVDVKDLLLIVEVA